MANSGSDDYELMPSHELDDLRHEVSTIKKNSMTEGDKARMLIESMDKLTQSINRFITILNDAQNDIIDEYKEAKPTEKLNQLLDQSETIAKVLISMNENINNNSNYRTPPQSSSSDYSSSPPQGTPNPNPNYSIPNEYSQPYLPGTPTPTPQGYSQGYSPQYSQAQGYNPMPSNFSPPQFSQQSAQSYSQQPSNFSTPQYSQQPSNYSNPQYSQGPSFNNMPPMSQQNTGMMNDPRNPLPIPSPTSTGNSPMNQQQMPFNTSMSMNSSSSLPDDFPPMEDIPPLDDTSNPQKKKFLGIMPR